MLTALIVVLRSIGLMCRGHRAVALENIALRQQLVALTHATKRRHLRPRDRFFWILLARSWKGWRSALLMVQPDTVVRWASPMAARALDGAIPAETVRPPKGRRGDSGAHRQDGIRE